MVKPVQLSANPILRQFQIMVQKQVLQFKSYPFKSSLQTLPFLPVDNVYMNQIKLELGNDFMPLMKAIQVCAPGGDFKLVQKEIPEPKEHEVLLKVQACGVCHGDAIVKQGYFPVYSIQERQVTKL